MSEAVESLNYTQPDKVAEMVKANCSKYLKLLGGKKPMFRGMETQYESADDWDSKIFIGKKKVRKNRAPQGTNPTGFKLVNKWLGKKKWPKRDKSIMMTSDSDKALMFGNAHYVFPINSSYGYAWVEANDFNDWDSSTNPHSIPKSWSIGPFETLSKTKPEMAEQMLEDFVHGNKHFDVAYNRGYEIWMDCNHYYLLYYDGMIQQKQKEFKDAFKKIGVKL